MPNRLQHETSPYLRQHADNPVDWHPWDEEALALARRLDRPIFLSIGYSACHWCHVMEHESFEDPEVGKILNDHFVSIKVDREERPDLDQIYMSAVQMLTGQGGWPMSVFLTPNLQPFYGGTYFPPKDAYGRPSFKRLLTALVDAYQNRRQEIDEQASNLTAHIQQHMEIDADEGGLTDELLRQASDQLRRAFDPQFGGFGRAPKFPHPMELRLALRLWKRFGDGNALAMARTTFDRMALGGIYDQLGGGFHRYSTDAHWLVPHFEKMLYDNALLTNAYLEAYQATRSPFYREVVEETLAYVQREMTSPAGAFYSTQDADSEGVEGKFFVWSQAEIEQHLGAEAAAFCAVYNVTPNGNWEGHNILFRRAPDQKPSPQAKAKLFEVRSQRVWPARDEKVLTAWNALMIDAFARAAQVLNQDSYARTAERAADFLLTRMSTPEGRLFRTTLGEARPKLAGYLDDYAYLVDALVTLYETTFEPRWYREAVRLAQVMVEEFGDSAQGGFFYTAGSHEALIARSKDPHDNATPSGNSMAATALLRLAKLSGDRKWLDRAVKTLQTFRGVMAQYPLAAGQMLLALDFYLGPVQEIAVVGERAAAEPVLRLVREPFRPHQVVAWKDADSDLAEPPLLADRTSRGGVTTYVCEDTVCQAPIVGVQGVQEALG